MTDQPKEHELQLRVGLSEPDLKAAIEAARRLEGYGLKIQSVTERGLSVLGLRVDIERAFSTTVGDSGGNLQFMVEPDYSRLPKSPGYRAYFPRQPEYFGR